MEHPFRTISLLLIAVLVIGVGYSYLAGSPGLQTSVLLSQPATTVVTDSAGNQVKADILAKVFVSEATQSSIAHFGVELENPSSSPAAVPVYAVGFDILLPPATDGVRVEEDAPVTTYHTFVAEAHQIDDATRTMHYRGYSGSRGLPLLLNPGEKKVVFSIPLRVSSPSGKVQKVDSVFLIQSGQVVLDPPVSVGSTQSKPVFAIDIIDAKIPVSFYPLGNPDLNDDGVINNLDVQYLFDFWNPTP
jgi:hypothetical protein